MLAMADEVIDPLAVSVGNGTPLPEIPANAPLPAAIAGERRHWPTIASLPRHRGRSKGLGHRERRRGR